MAMEPKDFLSTLVTLRMIQLYYHYCHNLVKGDEFAGYHELFSNFYNQVEQHYDRIIEYAVSELGSNQIDTQSINEAVEEKLSAYKVEEMDFADMVANGIFVEQDLQQSLEVLNEGAKLGLKNAVGDIAEKSDVRSYKLKQTLAQL